MSRTTRTLSRTPPRLLAPLDGAPVDGPSAVFRWKGMADGAGYEVQIASDAGFVDRWFDGEIGRTDTFTLLETLPNDDTTFYWRVRESGGEWSDTAAFRASDDEQVTSQEEAPAAPEIAEGPVAASRSVTQDDEPVLPPYLTGATGAGEAATLVAVFLLMIVVMAFIAITVGL